MQVCHRKSSLIERSLLAPRKVSHSSGGKAWWTTQWHITSWITHKTTTVRIVAQSTETSSLIASHLVTVWAATHSSTTQLRTAASSKAVIAHGDAVMAVTILIQRSFQVYHKLEGPMAWISARWTIVIVGIARSCRVESLWWALGGLRPITLSFKTWWTYSTKCDNTKLIQCRETKWCNSQEHHPYRKSLPRKWTRSRYRASRIQTKLT